MQMIRFWATQLRKAHDRTQGFRLDPYSERSRSHRRGYARTLLIDTSAQHPGLPKDLFCGAFNATPTVTANEREEVKRKLRSHFACGYLLPYELKDVLRLGMDEFQFRVFPLVWNTAKVSCDYILAG